jgi:CheY-like chemotaxis protein
MGSQLENLKIVVVDDQEEVRSALERYLSSLGAQVHTYDNVGQTLTAFRLVRPHLVICDIHLPRENGIDLLHGIRLLEQYPREEVPVIAMTGFVNEIEQIKARAPGFNGFLRKPFTPDTLLQIISELAKL